MPYWLAQKVSQRIYRMVTKERWETTQEAAKLISEVVKLERQKNDKQLLAELDSIKLWKRGMK